MGIFSKFKKTTRMISIATFVSIGACGDSNSIEIEKRVSGSTSQGTPLHLAALGDLRLLQSSPESDNSETLSAIVLEHFEVVVAELPTTRLWVTAGESEIIAEYNPQTAEQGIPTFDSSRSVLRFTMTGVNLRTKLEDGGLDVRFYYPKSSTQHALWTSENTSFYARWRIDSKSLGMIDF